jgi:hypothetical protein
MGKNGAWRILSRALSGVPMTQQAAQKRGFGCLGYGCIIAVVLVVLTIGGIFLLGRSAMRGAVERFTTEQQIPVPTVATDEGVRASLLRKIEELKRVIADPRGSGEFIFSQSELNGALAGTGFSGQAFLELQGDGVLGTFSFPLSAMGKWDAAKPIIGGLLNRYVTGSAQGKFSIADGVATVKFDSLVLNGQVFDGDALKEANEWVSGFANSQDDDPAERSQMARIQLARIENGSAVIRIRPE